MTIEEMTIAEYRAELAKPKAQRNHDGKSDLEEALFTLIKQAGLPDPQRQVKLISGRKFAVDFYWPCGLVVEVEGGVWMEKAGHTSGSGFTKDCRKYNAITILGYRLLRFTGNMIKSGEAVNQIEKALEIMEVKG